MGTLENTYCKNTEDNLRRYNATGWTYIEKLNDGNDFIVARTELGRELCHTVSNNHGGLQHYKFIEDVEEYTKEYLGIIGNRGPGPGPKGICLTDEDLNYTSGLSIDEESFGTSLIFDEFGMHEFGKMNKIGLGKPFLVTDDDTKKYTCNNVNTILEHILSFQTPANQWSISNSLNVDTIIRELNKFGFYPNPHGRKIDE